MSRNSAVDQLIDAAKNYSRWGGKAATKTLVHRLTNTTTTETTVQNPFNVTGDTNYTIEETTDNLTNKTIPLTFDDIASEPSLKAIKKAGDTELELSDHESFLRASSLEHITDPATKAAFMIDAYVRQIFKWKSSNRVTLGHFYNEQLWRSENAGSSNTSKTSTTIREALAATANDQDEPTSPLIHQIFTPEAGDQLKAVVYTEGFSPAIINAMLESCAPIASGWTTKQESRLADGREQLKKLMDYLLLIFTPQELADMLTDSVFDEVAYLLELSGHANCHTDRTERYASVFNYLVTLLGSPNELRRGPTQKEYNRFAGTEAFTHTALRTVLGLDGVTAATTTSGFHDDSINLEPNFAAPELDKQSFDTLYSYVKTNNTTMTNFHGPKAELMHLMHDGNPLFLVQADLPEVTTTAVDFESTRDNRSFYLLKPVDVDQDGNLRVEGYRYSFRYIQHGRKDPEQAIKFDAILPTVFADLPGVTEEQNYLTLSKTFGAVAADANPFFVDTSPVPTKQVPLPSRPYGGSSTFQLAPTKAENLACFQGAGSELTDDAAAELKTFMETYRLDKLIMIPHTESVLVGGGHNLGSRDETKLYCFNPSGRCIASFNFTGTEDEFINFTAGDSPVTPEGNADEARYFAFDASSGDLRETNASFDDEITYGGGYDY